jgi:hypothetical protein
VTTDLDWKRKIRHEGSQLDQENLSILQDHPAEGRAPRDLQEPEA